MARSKERVLHAIAGVATLALLALAILHFRETPPPSQPVVELDAAPPAGVRPGQLSVSPDGRHLVMSVMPPGSLWVRSMDSVEWREFSGTDAARYPFWSPDSTEIGFFADQKLRKVALAGGPSQTIAEALDGRGGSWGDDGTILFSPVPFGQVYSVTESGGDPVAVTEVGDEAESHRFPHLLPDGRHFLYQVSGTSPETSGIHLGSLGGEFPRRLLPDASNAIYVPSGSRANAGFVLFVREATLMAQPFDASRSEFSDGAVALPIAPPFAGNAGFYGFSTSASGVLAYGAARDVGPRRLAWVDRAGTVVDRTDLVADGLGNIELSPEGGHVAYSAVEGGNRDVWTYDLIRQTRIRLSDQPGNDHLPIWSSDGTQVAFRSVQPVTFGDVYLSQTDGSSAAVALVSETAEEFPFDWSHDGRFILYGSRGDETFYDLWYLERATSDDSWEPRLFLNTPANERSARLSPDGRHVAYVSDESGQGQVYVQPFPGGGRRTTVSTDGGAGPHWSRDGNELFYVAPGDALVAVEVSTRGEFSIGDSRRLFQRARPTLRAGSYDVSLDGQRFLVTEPVAAAGEGTATADSSVRVVMNWPAKFIPEQ